VLYGLEKRNRREQKRTALGFIEENKRRREELRRREEMRFRVQGREGKENRGEQKRFRV
jgi:hypothetical protein